MEVSMKVDGQKIRALREQKSWSQEHLASASGLSVRTIQRVEAEGTSLPETRLALAAALGVAAAELMPGEAVQKLAESAAAHGRKWGWIGWAAGVSCAHIGIGVSYLNGASSQDTFSSLGVVGAMAGISAAVIGVLSERAKRRTSSA
jgi:DNA-binding XRE family transcriptional regulator